ncbi:hypothetical protein B0J11DRAFT_49313 [Dendryphion nanum]|uniref:Uncharacterized protein n=1 Tax=Dendryphion nanum TaxID=256645 RepID=A0A9P9DHP5_9PLEO|nr:hypothetical protein B0J11DRAFT_49313 [Dendryphion nanum]
MNEVLSPHHILDVVCSDIGSTIQRTRQPSSFISDRTAVTSWLNEPTSAQDAHPLKGDKILAIRVSKFNEELCKLAVEQALNTCLHAGLPSIDHPGKVYQLGEGPGVRYGSSKEKRSSLEIVSPSVDGGKRFIFVWYQNDPPCKREHFWGVGVLAYNDDAYDIRKELDAKLISKDLPRTKHVTGGIRLYLPAWLGNIYAEFLARQIQKSSTAINRFEHELENINIYAYEERNKKSPKIYDMDEKFRRCKRLVRDISLQLTEHFQKELEEYIIVISIWEKPTRLCDARNIQRLRCELIERKLDDLHKQFSAKTARFQQLISLDMTRASLEIAQATRKDSRTMRAIAFITMFFLPATFITSFFGMNFFNSRPEKPGFDGAWSFVWVYFVSAFPLTAMVLAAFFLWEHIGEKKERELEKNRYATEARTFDTSKSVDLLGRKGTV